MSTIKEKLEEYDNTTQHRVATCVDCERFNKKLKLCKECGCFMPAKILIPSSKCPLDKW